jgi:O-methyltransferase involved in polyketide biosynthesis
MESRVLPGVCAHYTARKLAIQRTVLTIERPALVVIGAGYDGLAYRLAPTKIVIEVDRPEIQDQKCQLLERLPQRRMKFVAASLPAREALPILDVPVTYVAEGVFMYLSEQEVEQVLADLPAGSSIIFTFVGIDEQGRPAMGSNQDQVDRLLATLKEPFRWGIKQVAVAEFLARNGYRLVSLLGDGCEKIEGMIHGEWIAYANKL